MALNLKTLATRSLSGAIFVVLLMGSLLWSYLSFTVFFFAMALLALNEFYNIAEKLGSKPHRAAGVTISVLIYFLSIRFDHIFSMGNNPLSSCFFALYACFALIVIAVALFSKRDHPVLNAVYTIIGIIYAVLPFAQLHYLVVYPGAESGEMEYQPYLLMGIIFLIWSNDTFAYLGGSLFGSNKMIERISPGKTWEGTAFGVFVSFGISFLIQAYVDESHAYYWPVFGIVVPVLATIGDLVESMLKRQAGIKDSGNIMPGHGGALDRFDSLIFVTPFVVAFFYLVNAIS